MFCYKSIIKKKLGTKRFCYYNLIGLSTLFLLTSGCSSEEKALFLNTRVEDGVVILGSDPVIDDAYKVQKDVKFIAKDNILKPVELANAKAGADSLELDRPYSTNSSNMALGGGVSDSSTYKSKLRTKVDKLNSELLTGLNFDDNGEVDKTKISKKHLSKLVDSYSADMYENASDQELQALYSFVVAALSGKAEDQAKLADFYLDGFKKESHEQLAVSWYLMAANKGSTYSKYMISILYQLGVGLPQDLSESVNWYKKASEAKDSSAAKIQVAKRYLAPISLIHDVKQAYVWMESAANDGNSEAQYLLGDMYLQGRGVEKSELEAITWYGKAAEQNVAYAQYSLGVMYYNGQGTTQNLQEAYKWLENAGLQGHSEAQYLLGRMYEQGFGVEKSLPKAYAWWKLISKDNIVADNFEQKLGNLISSMVPAQRAEAEKLANEYKQKVGMG